MSIDLSLTYKTSQVQSLGMPVSDACLVFIYPTGPQMGMEMKMVMATLLGQFDIEHVGTADGSPVREQLQFTMAPMGLRMRLRERA